MCAQECLGARACAIASMLESGGVPYGGGGCEDQVIPSRIPPDRRGESQWPAMELRGAAFVGTLGPRQPECQRLSGGGDRADGSIIMLAERDTSDATLEPTATEEFARNCHDSTLMMSRCRMRLTFEIQITNVGGQSFLVSCTGARRARPAPIRPGTPSRQLNRRTGPLAPKASSAQLHCAIAFSRC